MANYQCGNKGWTAERKVAAVLQIIKGHASAGDLAEEHGLPTAEVERWVNEFLLGGEARLRADIRRLRPSRSVRVFICYAREDEPCMQDLLNQLSPLIRSGLMVPWHDRLILPGASYENEIEERLEASEIILLLVSSHLLASDYCRGKEMLRAMALHENGEARVIPIIVEHCMWQEEQLGARKLGDLQALPKDGKPISAWENPQEALKSVVTGVQRCAEEIRRQIEALQEKDRETLEAALAETIQSVLPEEARIAGESLQEIQRLLQNREISRIEERDQKLMPNIKQFLDDVSEQRICKPGVIVQKYGTAERAYFSDEFSLLREIGRHYERVGVLVRFGYLDINAIFEVVVFPDDFWEQTMPYQRVFRENWWGTRRRLPDFWKNFEYLQAEYERLRGPKSSGSTKVESKG